MKTLKKNSQNSQYTASGTSNLYVVSNILSNLQNNAFNREKL